MMLQSPMRSPHFTPSDPSNRPPPQQLDKQRASRTEDRSVSPGRAPSGHFLLPPGPGTWQAELRILKGGEVMSGEARDYKVEAKDYKVS